MLSIAHGLQTNKECTLTSSTKQDVRLSSTSILAFNFQKLDCAPRKSLKEDLLWYFANI